MKKVLPADFYRYYLVSNIRNSKRKRKYFSLIKIQDIYIGVENTRLIVENTRLIVENTRLIYIGGV